MKRKLVVLLAVAGLAVAAGTAAFAARPKPGPKPCRSKLIFCMDVWDPVTCDDGKTYSNQCYADRACATGCEPGGATQ